MNGSVKKSNDECMDANIFSTCMFGTVHTFRSGASVYRIHVVVRTLNKMKGFYNIIIRNG